MNDDFLTVMEHLTTALITALTTWLLTRRENNAKAYSVETEAQLTLAKYEDQAMTKVIASLDQHIERMQEQIDLLSVRNEELRQELSDQRDQYDSLQQRWINERRALRERVAEAVEINTELLKGIKRLLGQLKEFEATPAWILNNQLSQRIADTNQWGTL